MENRDSNNTSADPSTEMAQERTSLATLRTLFAAERTFMAWIRTAISMIGFGFTIFKFFQYLNEAEGALHRLHGPRNLGLTLIAFGVVTLFIAALQYWETARQLVGHHQHVRILPILTALLVGIIGIVAFVEVWR